MRSFCLLTFFILSSSTVFGQAEAPILTPDTRFIPGKTPTPWLLYQNSAARKVAVSGSWDKWKELHALSRQGEVWALDVRPLNIRFGRHEYKFIINDEWEKGENRVLYVSGDHLLEVPSDIVFKAALDDENLIHVFLKRSVADPRALRVRLEPEVPLQGWQLVGVRNSQFKQGYVLTGGTITFVMDERTLRLNLPKTATVCVAGNFNGWDGRGQETRWRLQDADDDQVWELTTQLPALRPPAGENQILFKFVINGGQWLSPDADAPNAVTDAKGNRNFLVDPQSGGGFALEIKTQRPLDLSQSYVVAIDGLAERTVRAMITPDGVFNRLQSDKELGVILNREQQATTYRLFAPRARSVYLSLYDSPYYETQSPSYHRLDPVEKYLMWQDPRDKVWELSLLGLDIGRYYAFQVDGPEGDGEGFNAEAPFGDPYARAVAHARNNSIVIDPDATNQWFGGWTDSAYVQPAPADVVIYETHVRDLTMHPSAGVSAAQRGRYPGILASAGTGTGLDHLKKLGVNMIELLPVAEFDNGVNDFNWGYATAYFFAPEASYAHEPLTGSQYYEFNHLVNELHRHGFGVILDVVFNHVGNPNVFNLIDKKYYFRLNPDFSFSNFSGVGNDVRTESPMMRRLIVDNILYWMKEHHVDGFRFDLAELIDMETMLAIRDAARALNPKILLISEPWSFRGENKSMLKGTGWSAWNNDFRYAAKDFACSTGDRDRLRKAIFGSVETWAANPLQPVNYLESHDDMALADELSTVPNHDGRNLIETDVKANRLAATLLFTSLGIPMMGEGQEFLRSKQGIKNTYDKGDVINALNWEDRNRPLAAETLAYYQGLAALRLSPAGAAFRVAERPPPAYYQWIYPEDHRALGYIVNAPQLHQGAGFIILLNSSAEPVTFKVNLPAGRWKMISNGTQIDPAGLPDAEIMDGPRPVTFRVGGVGSAIFRNGW